MLHRQGVSVEQACRTLEVSLSGYYDWRKRTLSKRERHNQALKRRLKLHEKYPAMGTGQSLSLAQAQVWLFPQAGTPSDAPGRYLLVHTRPRPTPCTAIPSLRTCSNGTSPLTGRTSPGWAISPTSLPARADYIWTLSKASALRKL